MFGSSTSGNLLLMAAVRRVSAGRTAGALLATPVSSAVIAAVVLGERLTPVGILGAALILVAMAIASGLFARRGALAQPVEAGPLADVAPDAGVPPTSGSSPR